MNENENKREKKEVVDEQLPLFDTLNSNTKLQNSQKSNRLKVTTQALSAPAKGVSKELGNKGKQFVSEKISEEEKENIGLEAFHKGVQASDKGISKTIHKHSQNQNKKYQQQKQKNKKEKEIKFKKVQQDEENLKTKWTDTSEEESKFSKISTEENFGTALQTQKVKDPRKNGFQKKANSKNTFTNDQENRFSKHDSETSKPKKEVSNSESRFTLNKVNKKINQPIKSAVHSLEQKAEQKVSGKLHEAGQENIAVETGLNVKEWTDRPRKFVQQKGVLASKNTGSFVQKKAKNIKSLASQRQHRKMQKKAVYDGQKKIKEAIIKAKNSVKATIEMITKWKTIGSIALICIFLFAILSACTTACTGFFQGTADYMGVTTYFTSDKEIEASTLQWTDLEFQLKERIDNIETEFPDFDEYKYDIDEMIAQPLELIAYLSAVYYEFTNPQVESEIISIFEQVNKLTLTESIEIRYDENAMPYEWKVLTVEMHTTNFDEVVKPRLDGSGKTDQYELYKETTGNRQSLTNPVEFDWRNKISCYYGYRQDPTGAMGGGKEFHTGLDIQCPTGTNVYSTQYGVVSVATAHRLYGNYIVINGANGVTTLYAHNSKLLVSAGDKVTPSTIIAKSGATGNVTGPHLHIEVKIGDQRVDPIFYLGTLPAGKES